MDLTKIRKLVKVQDIEEANVLLKFGMILLAVEDGEYILAQMK